VDENEIWGICDAWGRQPVVRERRRVAKACVLERPWVGGIIRMLACTLKMPPAIATMVDTVDDAAPTIPMAPASMAASRPVKPP